MEKQAEESDGGVIRYVCVLIYAIAILKLASVNLCTKQMFFNKTQ